MTVAPRQTAPTADDHLSPAPDDPAVPGEPAASEGPDVVSEPVTADEGLAAVLAELVAIREQLTAAHDRAAARERVIDRLHDENQRLRAGELRLVLRPVLVELQRLRNDTRKQAASLPATLTPAGAAELLESFAYSLELVLERADVRVVRAETGEIFDPACHRAVGVAPAEDPAQDGTVAQALTDGYFDLSVNRTAAHAIVTVYRWTPSADPGQS